MKRNLEIFRDKSKFIKLQKNSSPSLSKMIIYENCFNYLYFDQMPLEIKHKILSYLEISELLNMCKVSNYFSLMIQSYINSKSCFQTKYFHGPHSSFIKQQDNQSMIKLYQSIGRLYRCIYRDYSFTVNINFISSVLHKHVCFGRTNLAVDLESAPSCTNYSLCPSMTNFGHFLREFVSQWNETQVRRLFQTLIQYCFGSNFWKRFTRLLFKHPGTDIEEELVVRLFLRRVFLNPDCRINSFEDAWSSLEDIPNSNPSSTGGAPKFINQEEIDKYESAKRKCQTGCSNSIGAITVHQFPRKVGINAAQRTGAEEENKFTLIWLNEIIKSYHIGHQAKILFILYGPLHKNKLMWNAMCENTAADPAQVSACFGELGWTLRLLLSGNCWSQYEIVSVLEEMTNFPDEWLAENIACLLYTSGYAIASQYVSFKALKGMASEVAITLTSMCLVQVKLGTNFRNVLALVDKACASTASKREKRYLLDKLAVSFQDVIVDLYETDEIDNRLEDFSTLLKAQASFVRAIFKRMYEE